MFVVVYVGLFFACMHIHLHKFWFILTRCKPKCKPGAIFMFCGGKKINKKRELLITKTSQLRKTVYIFIFILNLKLISCWMTLQIYLLRFHLAMEQSLLSFIWYICANDFRFRIKTKKNMNSACKKKRKTEKNVRIYMCKILMHSSFSSWKLQLY